jgi:hypothetical protein
MAQNWNHIINFIHVNIGTKLTSIEISDDEFIQYIKENTLPQFSQHSPLKYWSVIDSSNITHLPGTFSSNVYKLNVPDGINIIDISEVYGGRFGDSLTASTYYGNPVDVVMANTMSNIMESLRAVNDYLFIRPSFIRFSQEPFEEKIIVELNIEHTHLYTIPSDLYQKLFKNMCLVDALELVINNRNKFTNITTPFGQIDLNIDYLIQKSQDLKQKISDIVDKMPPREFLDIF